MITQGVVDGQLINRTTGLPSPIVAPLEDTIVYLNAALELDTIVTKSGFSIGYSAGYASKVLAQLPTGYWECNEPNPSDSSSQPLVDSSTNALHGTINDTTNIGWAFAGAGGRGVSHRYGDNVVFFEYVDFEATSEFTFICNVGQFTEAALFTGGDTSVRLAQHGTNGWSGVYYSWLLQLESKGANTCQVRMKVSDGVSEYELVHSADLVDNVKQFITCSFESGEMKVSVNGVIETASILGTSLLSNAHTGRLYVGQDPRTGFTPVDSTLKNLSYSDYGFFPRVLADDVIGILHAASNF